MFSTTVRAEELNKGNSATKGVQVPSAKDFELSRPSNTEAARLEGLRALQGGEERALQRRYLHFKQAKSAL